MRIAGGFPIKARVYLWVVGELDSLAFLPPFVDLENVKAEDQGISLC